MAELAMAKTAIFDTDTETLRARSKLVELQKSFLLDQQKEQLGELEEHFLKEERGSEEAKHISCELRTINRTRPDNPRGDPGEKNCSNKDQAQPGKR